ncbi:uncharacterized protein BO88DRAFT_211196 [Aspergillus vadensis CBS 113365]|uniref:Uncharacterized protein n=1 Tax=Aspergillus vadensis (strain CBS 113365 / IMI 142717 / IBT 24658) TaxID=1448311 RepID=A0A319BJ57_ASPVC|nr:hypothetical protein BO88DRAFT_211196 [Aspergillus vadensis CBS 113365]PYH72331.1 hypothetical protein BO88DRAFT_211196 [Aspergillus vadensis CBS 113365]
MHEFAGLVWAFFLERPLKDNIVVETHSVMVHTRARRPSIYKGFIPICYPSSNFSKTVRHHSNVKSFLFSFVLSFLFPFFPFLFPSFLFFSFPFLLSLFFLFRR